MRSSWISLKLAVTQTVRRDDREDRLPGLHVVALLDVALGDPAVLRRSDLGPGQVELRLVELRPGLRHLRLELATCASAWPMILRHQVGLLHRGLRLRHLRVGRCAARRSACRCPAAWSPACGRLRWRRASASALNCVGLAPRPAAPAPAASLAGIVHPRAHSSVDPRIGELRLGHLQAALRLIARRDVGARIDLEQHVACLHALVVA